MKTFRSTTGPFTERPHFELQEIERLCADELQSVGLFPKQPEPVRIDRFVEKRFRVAVTYDDVPRGILGFTRFGAEGVESITVARALADEGSKVADRRLNTTIAHEAGHGLLHTYLFLVSERVHSLFDGDPDVEPLRILCRESNEKTSVGERAGRVGYDGRWWEWQANRAMGALLLPKQLVTVALADLTVVHGSLGRTELAPSKREEAVKALSAVFDVNPVVARLRLREVYPEGYESQLTL